MADIVERGLARRSTRVLDVAHADPQVEVRGARSGYPRDQRRAVRHRRRARPRRPRRVPVRARPRARPTRRMAVDEGARPPHRTHRQRQPQPARRGARSVARGARPARRRPGRRAADRGPGRRSRRRPAHVPRGELQPSRRSIPAYAPIADLPLAERAAALRDPELRAQFASRTDRRRRDLPDAGARSARQVLGGRGRRHRLRTVGRRLDWRRSPHEPARRPPT